MLKSISKSATIIWDDIVKDGKKNWLALSYSKKNKKNDTLIVQKSGYGGLNECKKLLRLMKSVVFAGLRVYGTHKNGTGKRIKFLMISWVPTNVSGMKKAKAIVHKVKLLQSFFKFYSITIDASSVDELSNDIIIEKLNKASGSHEPDKWHLSFGIGNNNEPEKKNKRNSSVVRRPSNNTKNNNNRRAISVRVNKNKRVTNNRNSNRVTNNRNNNRIANNRNSNRVTNNKNNNRVSNKVTVNRRNNNNRNNNVKRNNNNAKKTPINRFKNNHNIVAKRKSQQSKNNQKKNYVISPSNRPISYPELSVVEVSNAKKKKYQKICADMTKDIKLYLDLKCDENKMKNFTEDALHSIVDDKEFVEEIVEMYKIYNEIEDFHLVNLYRIYNEWFSESIPDLINDILKTSKTKGELVKKCDYIESTIEKGRENLFSAKDKCDFLKLKEKRIIFDQIIQLEHDLKLRSIL